MRKFFMSLESWLKLPRKEITTSNLPKICRLIEFCKLKNRIKIRYHKAGQTEERFIKPIRMVSVLSRPEEYLEADCETRNEKRLFNAAKLEIIEPVEFKSDPSPPKRKKSAEKCQTKLRNSMHIGRR